MATRRITTTAKGLGWQHQKQVARLKARHIDGTPCWWCGDPMYGDRHAHLNNDGQRLSGDHTLSRAHGGTDADRLMHLGCNKARGNGDNDHMRPALRRANGGHPRNVIAWDATQPA